MSAGVDLLFNMEDLAILANEKRPAPRQRPIIVYDSVFSCHFLFGITKQRIVEFKFLRKFLVELDRIAASAEVSDIELSQGFTTLTERFAFGRSASGERLGIPCNDDGLLIFKVRKLICLAVRSLKFEIWRHFSYRHSGISQTSRCQQKRGD